MSKFSFRKLFSAAIIIAVFVENLRKILDRYLDVNKFFLNLIVKTFFNYEYDLIKYDVSYEEFRSKIISTPVKFLKLFTHYNNDMPENGFVNIEGIVYYMIIRIESDICTSKSIIRIFGRSTGDIEKLKRIIREKSMREKVYSESGEGFSGYEITDAETMENNVVSSKCSEFIRDYVSDQEKNGRKKNVLIHGPLGTGKTTLAYIISHMLKRSVYVLTKECLLKPSILRKIGNNSVVLFDDVERMLCPDVCKTVMDFLDNRVTKTDRITIMISNDISQIDPAIIRPGRIDERLYVGNCDLDQLKRLSDMYKVEWKSEYESFVDKVTPIEFINRILGVH